MPAWRLTGTASSRAPTWLSGVCCDVIPFIPAASIRYLRSHSKITSQFGRRCIPFGCWCKNSEYPGIPAFSRLADRMTQRPELRFFLEPLASGQHNPAAAGTSPQALKKSTQPAIPYSSAVSKRHIMVPAVSVLVVRLTSAAKWKTTSSLTA